MPRIAKIIDLSMPIRQDMRLFPGMNGPTLKKAKVHELHGLQSTRLEMSVHAGTHLDAPRHFIERGTAVEEIPLEKLMGDAILLDLRFKSPGETITSKDMEGFERQIRPDDIVILHTGYMKYPDADLYCSLSPDTARWLVGKRIGCLATDTPSVDPVPPKGTKASNETHPAHHILLAGAIPIVENLTNLRSIPSKRIFFCCLPLSLPETEAAPARAVAIEFISGLEEIPSENR